MILLWLIALGIFLGILFLLNLFESLWVYYQLYSAEMDCKDKVYNVQPSPDHSKIAFVFIGNCSGKTEYLMEVEMKKAGENATDATNIFTTNGNKPATLQWLDNTHLLIKYTPATETYDKTPELWGVHMQYQAR